MSMKPPLVPTNVGATSVLPSGLRIDTRVLQQLEVPIVTFVIVKLMRCPAVPLNVGFAFCPGYWETLIWHQEQGRVCSIDKVQEELKRGGDDL